jgi:hypothetical protein
MWAETDFLVWWMKGSELTKLVTTSPPGTPGLQAGILGQSTTTNLFGGKPINEGERYGGRFTIGTWIDNEQTLGVEANALYLSNRATNFAASDPTGTRFIARPFINAVTGQETAIFVSNPPSQAGSIAITGVTDGMVGAGVLFRENFWCGGNWRIDVLGGYRFLRFADRLGITENQNSFSSGFSSRTVDRFDATNDFHGFDIGFDGEYRQGPWRIRGLMKLAVGENFELTDINGSQTSVSPTGVTTTNSGGFLALISNVGHLSRDRSIIIPEVGLQVGAQLTPHVRGWIGYSGLYWSEAVWAGKQIDRSINLALFPPSNGQVTGPVRPTPLFEGTSLWAHGVDVGLEVRY